MYHGPGPRYYNPPRTEPLYDNDGNDNKDEEPEPRPKPQPPNFACPKSVNHTAPRPFYLT